MFASLQLKEKKKEISVFIKKKFLGISTVHEKQVCFQKLCSAFSFFLVCLFAREYVQKLATISLRRRTRKEALIYSPVLFIYYFKG